MGTMDTIIFAVMIAAVFSGVVIFTNRLRGSHICRPERIRAKLMGFYYL